MVKKSSNKKKGSQSILNEIPLPREIENICKVLESTKLKFTTSYLKRSDQCEYCLEGVLARNAKIEDSELEDETTFSSIGWSDNRRLELLCQIENFYGFDPIRMYPIRIECPLPKCNYFGENEPQMLTSPEGVFTHINDEHNKKNTHIENARLIRLFSQYYNIVTGERTK